MCSPQAGSEKHQGGGGGFTGTLRMKQVWAEVAAAGSYVSRSEETLKHCTEPIQTNHEPIQGVMGGLQSIRAVASCWQADAFERGLVGGDRNHRHMGFITPEVQRV